MFLKTYLRCVLICSLMLISFPPKRAEACGGCSLGIASLGNTVPNLASASLSLLGSIMMYSAATDLIEYIKQTKPTSEDGIHTKTEQVVRLQRSYWLSQASIASAAAATATNAVGVGLNIAGRTANTKWAGAPSILSFVAMTTNLIFGGTFAKGIMNDSCGPSNGKQESEQDNPCELDRNELREKNNRMLAFDRWITSWSVLSVFNELGSISNGGIGITQILSARF